jgi:hypothetical protein
LRRPADAALHAACRAAKAANGSKPQKSLPRAPAAGRRGDILLVKGSKGSKVSLSLTPCAKSGKPQRRRKGPPECCYWLTEFSDGGRSSTSFAISPSAPAAPLHRADLRLHLRPPLIDLLRRKQGKGQPIRDDGPQSHFAKAGTPTMGGLLILSALMVSTPALGAAGQSLCLDRDAGDAGLRVDRLCRRLCQGDQAEHQGRVVAGPLGLACLIAALASYAAAMFHPAELTNQLAFRSSRMRC